MASLPGAAGSPDKTLDRAPGPTAREASFADAEALLSPSETVGSLAVRRAGSGPDLVLVHGGVGSWTHWIANVGELSRSFTLHLVDLPGFGASPDAPRQTDAYLDAVVEGLAALTDGPFNIAAFSFGAAIATSAAIRLGNRVAAMTLVGPAGFGVPTGRAIPLRQVPDFKTAPDENAAALAYNLGQFMLRTAPDPDDPVVALHRRNIARARFDSRRLSHLDSLVADLARTSMPLQMMWGEGDVLAYPSIAERAALCRAARPDLVLQVIPHAGHWTQFENPAAVNARLARFHERKMP